jgi:2-oxoglutarate dehydrogenase E2 component (dihydrolipoamide succinyltransferase)
LVPRLNSNDEACQLVEWLSPDGSRVADGDAIAVVETSKATAEIYSDGAGVICLAATIGSQCRVGEAIGYLFDSDDERRDFLARQPEPGVDGAPDDGATRPTAGGGQVLTAAARRLAASLGVSDAQVQALGKKVVREADIQALASAREPAPDAGALPGLSTRQQAVASVVTRSHRAIPDSFVAMDVACDRLTSLVKEANGAGTVAIGLPEVAVAVVAGLRSSFGQFFAGLDDDGRLIAVPAEVNVGVTLDVGTGLFVPVVRDAANQAVREIAGQLMDFRIKALRMSFRADELSGGQLTVSLNTDAGVRFAIPIIAPGEVCALSIGATRRELGIDEGRVVQRSYFTAGLAYDHRVVNGREAAQFLAAFKSAIEQPDGVRL